MRITFRLSCLTLGPILLFGLAGCGNSDLASVSGTVTYKGKPVTGGSLIFSPVGEGKPGKPGSAEIKDGSFVVQTDGDDGAVIGRVRITFTPPPQVLTEEQRHNPRYKAPPPLYMGLVPKDAEVTVNPGSNTINIELVGRR